MSLIFESIVGDEISIITYLICIAFAVLCGCITALAAYFRNESSKSLMISLVILPAIVTTVILMVNGNIGTGIAVAGAFSLVRFRSAPGKAREIAEIFLVMTAGIACAAGYVGIAVMFTVLVCFLIVIISKIQLGNDKQLELHITVPESLNFTKAFDDLFDRYTSYRKLIKAKTSGMGSMYKLVYRVELKDTSKIQDVIDELRCRNGNLEIALMDIVENEEL